VVVVVVIEGIVFFEGRRFIRDKSEGEPLILVVLVIIVVVVEKIVFFEKKRFVRGRSEDKPLVLMIVVIVIEGIVFAVFNLEDMRDLIISIIVDLTNSIISLLMTSGRYEN
jgi:hypothetical protein